MTASYTLATIGLALCLVAQVSCGPIQTQENNWIPDPLDAGVADVEDSNDADSNDADSNDADTECVVPQFSDDCSVVPEFQCGIAPRCAQAASSLSTGTSTSSAMTTP